MEIKKEVISKIEREYFFVVGDLDVDAPYFIDKINKSVEGKDNINYKTNVIKFFYDPIYQVHEPTRSPSELIETSIREVTQQLYGRKFNILRM